MIRIVLLGRTGNNLFQYALGRVLSEKHGVPLVLDASWFNQEGWREVSHFLKLPIQATVVRPFSLASRSLRKLTGKHYWEYRGVPFIREAENDHSYQPDLLDAPDDCALFGYFQSWRYFSSIENELREELINLLKQGSGRDSSSTMARASRPELSSLTDPESVAIHVRRGDFLHHPAFQVCDQAYYEKAMDDMRKRLDSPRFFLFSDDPAWCRAEFKREDVQIIDSGKAATNPLHDLHLMSLASHHIIANSTYSWWAAWLGEKTGQQLIMPTRWFAHGIKAPIHDKNWK